MCGLEGGDWLAGVAGAGQPRLDQVTVQDGEMALTSSNYTREPIEEDTWSPLEDSL